jgi:predicted nucleic acid-binding protein
MTVLDTNVISELMRPEPSPHVIAWLTRQPTIELCTTSVTEAEIFYGIALLPHGRRRDELGLLAQEIFAQGLEGRVVAFDSDAARMFASIAAQRRALGKPISHVDAQIAATARVLRAKLATRNVRDFAHCDLELINPWSS